MTNWDIASKILASAPRHGLCAYDSIAMPGARLIAALKTEQRTREAIRKEEMKKMKEKSNREMERMKVEERRAVAKQIRSHYNQLCGDATRDALRPSKRGGVLWLEPKMHGIMAEFITSIKFDIRVIDGSRWKNPNKGILAARVNDAAVALDRLRESFETARNARDCMRKIHQRYEEAATDVVVR